MNSVAPPEIPNAQLAVLPGTDHAAIMTRNDLLLPMINWLLDGAPEATA
jgi:hypothetical protein